MLNRSTTWAVVFLVATFAAGLAVGAGGRALWVRYASAAAPDRGRGLDRMMDELTEELRLDPAQRDSVRAIVRSEERRVGKECSSRGATDHVKNNNTRQQCVKGAGHTRQNTQKCRE